jgi:hypothetical protein
MVFSLFFSSILATLKLHVPDIYIAMVSSMHNVCAKNMYNMPSMSIRNQSTQGTACHKQTSHHDVCNAPTLLHPAQHALMPSAMTVDSLPPAPPTTALEGTTMTDMEVKTMLHDLAAMKSTYQQAINGTGDKNNKDNKDNGSSDDGDERHLNQGNKDDVTHVEDTMRWVNFNMHYKGGQQMKALVLKLYKVSTLHGLLWPLHAHHLMLGMAT